MITKKFFFRFSLISFLLFISVNSFAHGEEMVKIIYGSYIFSIIINLTLLYLINKKRFSAQNLFVKLLIFLILPGILVLFWWIIMNNDLINISFILYFFIFPIVITLIYSLILRLVLNLKL